jgi:hypothetical protein
MPQLSGHRRAGAIRPNRLAERYGSDVADPDGRGDPTDLLMAARLHVGGRRLRHCGGSALVSNTYTGPQEVWIRQFSH